jgi:hypothetical protein
VVREAHQADNDTDQARQHDASQRDPQRVGHAGHERAQVAVACGEFEQHLADVEAGRRLQEVEARLDLARLEIDRDVVGDPECDDKEQQCRGALHEPFANAAGTLPRAPGSVADCRGGCLHHGCGQRKWRPQPPFAIEPTGTFAPAVSGSGARTSGRPWSTGC